MLCYCNKSIIFLATLCFYNYAYAIDAPVPLFDGQNLNWNSVDAASYNIHKGNGDYIETVGANVNSWAVSESGDYFIVATDGVDWRSWGRSAVVSAILGSDDPHDNDDPPITASTLITNARADVYSTTAIELFWEPVATGEYSFVDVYRDGQSQGTTDGRSWFENQLMPNTTYEYSLVPHNIDGNPSDAVKLSVTTNPTGSPSPDPDPEIDGKSPMQPKNPRVEVYSSTAVELFWEHAEDYIENNVAYIVYQDGIMIAEGLDASSLYIDKLESGQTYSFAIGAVANMLYDSEPVSIRVTTNGSNPGPTNSGSIINAENVEQIMADAVAIINMSSANELIEDVRPFAAELSEIADGIASGEPVPEELLFLSQTNINEGTDFDRIETQFGCLPDGDLTLNEIDYGDAPFLDRTATSNNCTYNNATYSGAYTRQSGRRVNTVDSFSQLERIRGSEVIKLTGERRWSGNIIDTVLWSNVSFDFAGGLGRTTVNNLNLERLGSDTAGTQLTFFPVTDLEGQSRNVYERNYSSSLDASFEMVTPATTQQLVSVDVDLQFENNYWVWDRDFSVSPINPSYPVSDLGPIVLNAGQDNEVTIEQNVFDENAQWQTGQVRITATDGSNATLLTSSDNPEELTLIVGEGEQTSKLSANGAFSIHCSSIILGCGNDAQPRFLLPLSEESRFAN